MRQQVVPLLHCQDLRGAVAFYETLGFSTLQTYKEDDSELTFAVMQLGNSVVMLNSRGAEAKAERRDADLYIYANGDELYSQLKAKAEIVVDLHETFYGNREFTIRDNDGFWLTFGSVISDAEDSPS